MKSEARGMKKTVDIINCNFFYIVLNYLGQLRGSKESEPENAYLCHSSDSMETVSSRKNEDLSSLHYKLQ